MRNKPDTTLNATLDAGRCWALLRRGKAVNPAGFLYGVRTTGVYCRPGCASRLPKRDNVNFFKDAREAESHGFRACKRCRPDQASPATGHARAIQKAVALIKKSEAAPSLHELAQAAALSPYHFHRMFKKFTGATPRDYLRAHRLRQFGKELEAGKKVTEAIFEAGFNSSSRAYADVPALGMVPKARGKKGAGEVIRYALGKTALGLTLVAVTDKGLCMTGFGDSKQPLMEELRRRFSNAALTEDTIGLKKWLKEVAKFLEAPADKTDLPLDLRGTAFQARVWRMLQKIPPGKTASYTDVARRMKQPAAVRAVASACGANPVALFVPCHRVLRKGGALGGYHWGLKRKKQLLKKEAEGN